MLYDTSLQDGKLYQNLMRTWTEPVLIWVSPTKTAILVGAPSYHGSGVENLPNALLGIHTALDNFPALPSTYQGVALYSEWKMTPPEWQYWQAHFTNP